jgi:catechol 2,3-dioxygenase-like lactoylglutathione lyase family enzyme
VDVLFMASFSPIVTDVAAGRRFFGDTIGLRFEGSEGDYVFTSQLDGVKHFGLWPLTEAAQATFGSSEWPPELPVPQASVEFEVADVSAAATELEAKGCRLLHGAKVEPWGQETARLLSPDGLLVAVCRTPWLHTGEESNTAPRSPSGTR